jgi:late competence protein required for DNA uptake (superfamily II DNA/RNA helicase)
LNSTRFSSEEKRRRRRREKKIYISITQPLPNNKSQRREIKSRLKLISLSTAFFFPPLFSPGYMYFYIFLSGEYDQQLQQAAIRGKNGHVQKDSHRNQMVMNRPEIYFLREKKR